MIDMIVAYTLTVAIIITVIHIIEIKIPESNRFKKWWRKNIIGQDIEL